MLNNNNLKNCHYKFNPALRKFIKNVKIIHFLGGSQNKPWDPNFVFGNDQDRRQIVKENWCKKG